MSGQPPLNVEKAQEIVDRASDIAAVNMHQYVTLEHILASLLVENAVIDVLNDLEVDVEELGKDLVGFFQTGSLPKAQVGQVPRQTPALVDMIRQATARVMLSGRQEIKPSDLLVRRGCFHQPAPPC